MRRPSAAVLLLLAVGVAVAGCTTPGEKVRPYRPPAYYDDSEPPLGRDASLRDIGRHLYQRDCAFCHGNRGQGTRRGPDVISATNGPALIDFVLRSGRMPVEKPVNQTYPAETKYSQAEIAALISYVDEEFRPRGPEIPEIHLSEGKLGEGQELYAEHCGACHALTGIGGAMLAKKPDESGTEGVDIPSFRRSSPIEIAEAIRTGPGTMPVFGERALDEEELNSLVRYVTYLQDPDDEGGFPVLRVGPVAEGAVGWILGLGVLVLFTRLIGTKTGEETH